MTSTFEEQISLMIDNLERLKTLGQVNLVFEGGSLNGYYLLGVAMFLKEMERRKLITVNKVSGTSIGAYIAFHYLNNTLNRVYEHGIKAKEIFKERVNLSYFKDILLEDLSGCDVNKLNNRLFVSYYDIMPNIKRNIQSEFNNVNELYDAIISSAYLPFLIDGGVYYETKTRDAKCIDGGLPYIFENEHDVKILYVKLSGWNKIGNMFTHRGEKDGRGRVCEGIISTYNFFLYGENGSDMCSWLYNWTSMDHILYKLKHFVCIVLVCLIVIISKTSSNINYEKYLNLDEETSRLLMCLLQKILDGFKDIIVSIVA
jgi:hypothetical protein